MTANSREKMKRTTKQLVVFLVFLGLMNRVASDILDSDCEISFFPLREEAVVRFPLTSKANLKSSSEKPQKTVNQIRFH